MAILALAVWDTEENKRSEYTWRTLTRLVQTVDLKKHRIIISDNGSCQYTQDCYTHFKEFVEVIYNKVNIGTAKAINVALKLRNEGENFIKMDNDIFVYQKGWVDQLEECVKRESSIGIIGLKRKDLWQHPLHENEAYRTYIQSLPHEAGQRWLNIEVCPDIMGSCTMLSSSLIEAVGGFTQEGVYGFDDTDMSLRSLLAGFKNAFLPHIEIDHIDEGNNAYTEWKQKASGATMAGFNKRCEEYKNGTRSLFVEI